MSTAATTQAKSGGCLKCGELGHWARDCKAPKEKWLPRDRPSDGPSDAAAAAGLEPQLENVDQNTAPLGAAAAAKQKRKRPKVTFDLLKQSNGLPDIYHNFPVLFRQQFRGKGHEVSDLRRLLEMYKRWQDRIFPHGEFDHFIAAVEKLSGSNIVKKELQDMRVDLLQAVTKAAQALEEPTEEQGDAIQDDGDLLAFDMAFENHQHGDNDDDEELVAADDDDELLNLLGSGGGGGGGGGEAAAEGEAAELDDDELLAMLGADIAEENGQNNDHVTNAADGNAIADAEMDDDDADDDALLAMLGAQGEQENAAVTDQVAADEDDDDALLAMLGAPANDEDTAAAADMVDVDAAAEENAPVAPVAADASTGDGDGL